MTAISTYTAPRLAAQTPRLFDAGRPRVTPQKAEAPQDSVNISAAAREAMSGPKAAAQRPEVAEAGTAAAIEGVGSGAVLKPVQGPPRAEEPGEARESTKKKGPLPPSEVEVRPRPSDADGAPGPTEAEGLTTNTTAVVAPGKVDHTQLRARIESLDRRVQMLTTKAMTDDHAAIQLEAKESELATLRSELSQKEQA